MTEPALRVSGITKWFGEDNAKTYAVRNASFEVQYGKMLYIVGPSGSGKTTLLSMISGILKPNMGNVLIENRELWQMTENEIADFRLHKIGFVFQDYHLFPRLTTVENVAIPLVLQKVDWDKAITMAMEILEIVGLKDRAQLPPLKLSGGEQQRVAIARAIVAKPDLLILDEPTASLDGETGRKIVEFVKKNILNDKRCIIIVTHDSRIFEYADEIMTMEDGAVTGIRRQVA